MVVLVWHRAKCTTDTNTSWQHLVGPGSIFGRGHRENNPGDGWYQDDCHFSSSLLYVSIFCLISLSHELTPGPRTWADWSSTFNIPVYTVRADSEWLNRQQHPTADLRFLSEPVTELAPGVHSIICGGHFPGSQVLHVAPPNTDLPTLFVADAIFPAQSARNPDPAKPGQITYMFLWSIPNMIPLSPDEVLRIWRILKPWDFAATYGVMAKWSNCFERKTDRKSLKQRLLDSAQIAVKAMGQDDHEIFQEIL